MKIQNVLAVQLPAPCPLNCLFCRTPDHNVGDPNSVYNAVTELLNNKAYDELYLTSNGETGLSPIFTKTIDLAKTKGVPVSVLCATERSVVSGLKRVEVSYNEFTKIVARRAIEKAKELGIPVVVSVVDDGKANVDCQNVQLELSVDGVLIRAQQAEGSSRETRGKSKVLRSKDDIGVFPVIAYRELSEFGDSVDCINQFGQKVKYLGAA